eukprot:GILJ01020279.1.p1 GENE.GILJ01020279.1~~GILJ01020279.1.p1  ORF type:complete len:1233 (-),score=200.85 GILJ01020279.1:42-3278(-)
MENSEEMLNKMFTPAQQEQLKRFTTPEGLAEVEAELQQKIDAAREEAAEASRQALLTSFENYKQSLVDQCSKRCQTEQSFVANESFGNDEEEIKPPTSKRPSVVLRATPSETVRSQSGDGGMGAVQDTTLPPAFVNNSGQLPPPSGANSLRRDSTLIANTPSNTSFIVAPGNGTVASAMGTPVVASNPQPTDGGAVVTSSPPLTSQELFTKDRVISLEKLVESLEIQLKEKGTEVKAVNEQVVHWKQECDKEVEAAGMAKAALEELKIANKVLLMHHRSLSNDDHTESDQKDRLPSFTSNKRVSIQEGGIMSPTNKQDSPLSTAQSPTTSRLKGSRAASLAKNGADSELEFKKDTAALIGDLEDEVGELKDDNARLRNKMTRLQRDYESKVRQVCEKAAEDLKQVVTAANNTITTTSETILSAAVETEKQRKLKEKELQRRVLDPNALADGSDFYASGRYVPTAWAAFESAGGSGRTSMLKSNKGGYGYLEPFLPTIRIAVDRCEADDGDQENAENENASIPQTDLTFVTRYNTAATVLEAHHRQQPTYPSNISPFSPTDNGANDNDSGHGRMTLKEGWAFRDVATQALVVIQLQCFMPDQSDSYRQPEGGDQHHSSFEQPFTFQRKAPERNSGKGNAYSRAPSYSGSVSTPRQQHPQQVVSHPRPPFIHYPDTYASQQQQQHEFNLPPADDYDIVGDGSGGVVYPKPVSVKKRIFGFNQQGRISSHHNIPSSGTSNLSSPNYNGVGGSPSNSFPTLMRKEADSLYSNNGLSVQQASTWPLRDLPGTGDTSQLQHPNNTSNLVLTPRRDTGVDVIRNGPRGTKASDLRRKVGDATAAALELEEAKLEAALTRPSRQGTTRDGDSIHRSSSIVSASTTTISRTQSYSNKHHHSSTQGSRSGSAALKAKQNAHRLPPPPPFVVSSAGGSSRHLSGLLSDQQRRHLDLARRLVAGRQQQEQRLANEVFDYSDDDEESLASDLSFVDKEGNNEVRTDDHRHGDHEGEDEEDTPPPPPQTLPQGNVLKASSGDSYEYLPSEEEGASTSQDEDDAHPGNTPTYPPSAPPSTASLRHHQTAPLVV